MPRALPRHSSRLAGRQHDQANIAAHKEFAQRLGIDVAVSTLLIAEAQVGLWLHPAQWCLAIHTLALFSIVEFLTIFIGAETTKSAVPIKVDGITWEDCLVVIKEASTAVRTEIRHQIIEGHL